MVSSGVFLSGFWWFWGLTLEESLIVEGESQPTSLTIWKRNQLLNGPDQGIRVEIIETSKPIETSQNPQKHIKIIQNPLKHDVKPIETCQNH